MILRWWKQHVAENLVGLDFGSDAIKLLKINLSEQPFKIENFAIAPLPAGVSLSEATKDYSVITNILKDLFRQIEATQVAFAIPRSAVIIKNTTIDKRFDSTEIESRVWIEANRHFPDLVGEIYLDYNPIGPSAEDPKLIDFVLVACRKEQARPYLEAVRQAGLIAKVVDVNCYALERALAVMLQDTPQLETVALLNLDFTLSSLILTEKRNLVFAHDQSYDGRRLLALVREYVDKKENIPADSVIEKASLQDAGYLAILKDNLSVHLRHSMHFFYSSRPNITIQKIVLAGDLAAVIPDLALFVQQEVGIETMVANPFTNMVLAPTIDKKELLRHAPALMLCCGLALSHSGQIISIKNNKTGQETA